MQSSDLRAFIGRISLDQKTEGTSAFGASLREILVGKRADEGGFEADLVRAKYRQVSDALPPVAILVDYGARKYQLEKRARDVAKKYAPPLLKIIRMRYSIDANDYKIKLVSVKKLLEKGYEISLIVALVGREIQHFDAARALLQRFADDLGELAVWREDPKIEGKTATMFLTPAKRG